MKTALTTVIMTMFLFCTITAQAKIRRVNNNPNIKADFTTAQGAVDSSNAGDTIHLEPSVNNYGAVNLTKKLVMISVGYFLSNNPGNQVSLVSGRISSLTMVSTAAAGSTIMLQIDGNISATDITNILLKRCYVGGYVYIKNCTNITLNGIYVYGNVDVYNYRSIKIANSQNILVTNNILRGSIAMDGEQSSAIVVNNVLNTYLTNSNINYIYNCRFQNNIINKSSRLTFSATCTIQNNFASSTTFPTTTNSTNNQSGVNMANVFVNSSGSDDNDFQVQPSSITVGAGIGGVDCGAFGGATPYKLAGQPPVPAIYKLTIPATVAGDSIHVTFSTKSNN